MGDKDSYRRTRYFTGVTYLNKSSFETIYNTFRSRIRGIAYVIHDKDVNKNGKPETPHVQFMVHTKSSHSSSTVAKWFKRFQFADETGVISVLIQCCNDVCAGVDYLTHFCDPDKYQYEYKDIVRIGDCSFLRLSNLACDYTADIVDRMTRDGESLRLLAYEYGKDFVYHYSQYRSLAEDIRLQESSPTFKRNLISDVEDFIQCGDDDIPF